MMMTSPAEYKREKERKKRKLLRLWDHPRHDANSKSPCGWLTMSVLYTYLLAGAICYFKVALLLLEQQHRYTFFQYAKKKYQNISWSIFFFFSLSKRQQLSKAFIPHKIEKGNVVSLFSDGQNSAGVYIYFCIWSFYSFGKVGGTHFLLHFW